MLKGPDYFLPDFLMPWDPAFMGPLPLAFSAISLLALAAAPSQPPALHLGRLPIEHMDLDSPAFCFSWNALSSSSISFFSFLGAFRGLALPPVVSDISEMISCIGSMGSSLPARSVPPIVVVRCLWG